MAMLLKGRNGAEFELGVSREAFPEVQDTGGGRWATINIRAATADGDTTWEETAPCLNLFELTNLVEWLETVGQSDESEGDQGRHGGEGDSAVLELLQPELVFAVTGYAGGRDESDDEESGDAALDDAIASVEDDLAEMDEADAVDDEGADEGKAMWVTIRIGFHIADRDEIFNVDTDTDEAEYLDLHVDRRSVLAAAEALRGDLEGLPMQGNEKDAPGLKQGGTGGDDESGILGVADEGLNIIDDEKTYPPGAGEGEDNAGGR